MGGQASSGAEPEISMAEAGQADVELWNLGRVRGGHGWAGGGHAGLMMPSGPQYGCAPNPLSIPILQGLTVCSSTDVGLWVSMVNVFNYNNFTFFSFLFSFFLVKPLNFSSVSVREPHLFLQVRLMSTQQVLAISPTHISSCA